MTAYELADALQETEPYYSTDYKLFDNAANILRQQADRIAELEKFNKAILKKGGYPYEKSNPIAYMSPDGKVSTTEGILFHIPLYTKPQTKPLSDEEIAKEWIKFYPDVFHTHLIDFVRAIEERHGIK